MKSGIHPQYHAKAKVRCVCGATYSFGSTKESYSVEICSACHPFYTGKQKLVDTAGRVDRFKTRQKIAEMKKAELQARVSKKQIIEKETIEEKITRKVKEKEEVKAVPVVKKPVVKKTTAAKKPAAKKVAKKK